MVLKATNEVQVQIDALNVVLDKTICPLMVCLTENMCMSLALDEQEDKDKKNIALFGRKGNEMTKDTSGIPEVNNLTKMTN
jgi:hypothetical protein